MEEARLTASMEREHPYAGERVELATKHSKESAIAPALAERLGLRVHTPLGVDTDALGTFTGEVERVGSPREVAARKARLALDVTGHWLGLASEGSFGPHPVIPVVPADDEWLALVDDRRDIVVYERFISLETNFGGVEVRPEDDLTPFLARARFPSHGLVVRPEGPLRLDVLYKGVTDSATLRKAVVRCAALSPQRRAGGDGYARPPEPHPHGGDCRGRATPRPPVGAAVSSVRLPGLGDGGDDAGAALRGLWDGDGSSSA